MKKLILSALSMVIMSPFVIGQDTDDGSREKFHFGIKAGANYANVYDADGEDFEADPKFGFAGGVFVAIPLSKYFGIQPEILYSQKGFQGEGTLLGSPYSFTRTTDFIDLPLFLVVKPLPILSILVGPQLSYLLKRTDRFKSNFGNTQQIEEFNNDNIRKNILSATLGVDINLAKVIFGARAGWDLYTNNGDGTSQTPRYKNAWVQATVGYRFL